MKPSHLRISGKINIGDAAWSRGVHKPQPKEVVMFTAKVGGKSKSATLKIVGAMLALMVVVVLGPGQALAHDDRDDHDRGDYRWHHRADACAQTSKAALTACRFAAREEYSLALGRCKNVSKEEQGECIAEAKEGEDGFYSALEECNEQFDARQEVCEADGIGPGPYLPDGIDPGDFVETPTLLRGYFPLVPGTTYVYKNYDEDGVIQETIVVEVKDETREIDGVQCRVVQDTAYEGDSRDEKIEDTTDWYALQSNGDVWYFGEIALNYEEGVVTNIDGSWTTGMEGAKPGILMYRDPGAHTGETYRQEFALSEAEDVATMVEILTPDQFEEVDGAQMVPDRFKTGNILHTLEFSALEPGVFEDKYYAPGIGNVLVVNEDAGEMEVLIRKAP
jgi:hypothetical protein